MASFFNCYIFLLAITLGGIMASHKRAGIIMWKPIDPTVTTFPIEIEVSFRVAWRRSTGTHFCNATTIEHSHPTGNEGSLSCFPRGFCSPSDFRMEYKCTDFDVNGDWTAGANSYRVVVSDNNRDFFLQYSGCCWISTLEVGANDNWFVRSRVNLAPRTDNGLINSSPRTTMTPVLRVVRGCTRTFIIRTNDPDGDVVKCRNGNNAAECGGECDTFSAIATLSSNCALEISAGFTGLYRATLILEDFYDATSTEPISSIPLQFIISVFDGDQPCESLPEFVPDTPLDNQCIPFLATADGVENTFKVKVKAGPKNDGTPDTITNFITSSPIGVTRKGPIVQVMESGMSFAEQTFTWTPTLEQLGEHTFCITAESANRIPSAERCFTLNVMTTAVDVPRLIGTEPGNTCAGLQPTLETFKFSFNREILKPKAEAFIKFFEIGTPDKLVYQVDTSQLPDSSFDDKMLILPIPDGTFESGKGYYVTMEVGVVTGGDGCGTLSLPITDTTRLRFNDNFDQCYETNTLGQRVRNYHKLIPDCLNCERYIPCSSNTPTSMPCPAGTRFDRNLGLCNHKGQTQCVQGPVSDDPCAFVDNGGIIKDPVECPKYIVCDHGVSSPKECPAGTIFSVITNVCEHSGTPVCPDQQTPCKT